MPSSRPNKDLPPSVETAYYRKCVELRRRINDIEENNDATRARIQRLRRGIKKMRLERAFLLERLAARMEYNVDDSDRSESPPPTPHERPMRTKRPHRKGTPPANASTTGLPSQGSPPTSVAGQQSTAHGAPAMSSAHSTPDPSRSGILFNGTAAPTSNGASASPLAHPSGPQTRAAAPLFLDNPYADEPGRKHENGGGADAKRPYGAGSGGRGATGEMLGAGPDVTVDANGDRGVPPDTEMTDAEPAAGSSGGGFTAVNR